MLLLTFFNNQIIIKLFKKQKKTFNSNRMMMPIKCLGHTNIKFTYLEFQLISELKYKKKLSTFVHHLFCTLTVKHLQ